MSPARENELTGDGVSVLDSKPGLWYQNAVRLYAVLAVPLVCAAACGSPPASGPTTASPGPKPTSDVASVNPARIERARQELPPGYEVVAIDPNANPVSLWGFGPDWAADPAECAVLVAPETDPGRGWSASGPGGIVYAAVSKRNGAAGGPGPATQCDQWSVSGGHSTGTVTAIAAPVIEGAVTAGMTTAVTTVVEGGTETRSHADTFTADLGVDNGVYHLYIAVVTDPGSPNPGLDTAFASDLLVKTVSVLRG